MRSAPSSTACEIGVLLTTLPSIRSRSPIGTGGNRPGSAADAAIAAVAMQCVVEPESTGIGGDCFILYSRQGALPVALNGSGRAPVKATVDWYVERGIGEIGVQTPHAVTIPGAIDAWCTFNREHGTRPLAELLEPAARAAEDGYVVTPRVAADWHNAQQKLRDPVTPSGRKRSKLTFSRRSTEWRRATVNSRKYRRR